MQQTTCPLCGLDAEIVGEEHWDRVHCQRCGIYRLDGWQVNWLSQVDDKHLLSGATRNSLERGHWLELTPDNVDAHKATAPASWDVEAKSRILLRHLARKSGYPGRTASIVLPLDLTLCYARDDGEFKYYFEVMRDQGWLTWDVEAGTRSVMLTRTGWIESQVNVHSESNQAFVAMHFHKSTLDAYENGIVPAIKLSGYEAVRVDRLQHNDKIDDRIIAGIRESRFLVADFTGHRQSVYFEAGFAKGLGIPVIWVCKEDQLKDSHFDTRQYNHIGWNSPDELQELLKDRICATMGRGPLQP